MGVHQHAEALGVPLISLDPPFQSPYQDWSAEFQTIHTDILSFKAGITTPTYTHMTIYGFNIGLSFGILEEMARGTTAGYRDLWNKVQLVRPKILWVNSARARCELWAS